MTNDKTQICILGGGFGGLYTALYLSRCAAVRLGRVQIILVEQNDHFLFTPLLYELITGELQRWEIAPSYEKLLRQTPIHFCQLRIQSVDLGTRQVRLANGDRLNYDYLVLAVGNQTRTIDIPGGNYALSFRSLADVEQLQEKLRILEASGRNRLNFAVIGGGPNGVELACKLADRLRGRVQVHLIERGEQILKAFSPGVRKATQRAFKARKIQIHYQTSVKAIDSEQITLIRDEEILTMAVDLVIWAAGTQAREWIQQLDCQKNAWDQLLTQPTLQLLDYPEVFALGDLAQIQDKNQAIPITAQAAFQQASCAAHNLKALLQGKRLKRFRYLHLGDMLTLGQGSAVVSSFFLNLEGAIAAIIRCLVYIQRLPTFRHRWQVFKHLLMKAILS